LNCTFNDVRPAKPVKVKVGVHGHGSVVSKLGYWVPRGQEIYTGRMQQGPTVTL
jgi:hypothetical protein